MNQYVSGFMKLLYSLSLLLLAIVPHRGQTAVPQWFIDYEITHLESPQATLNTLLQAHKTMPAGVERIYLSTIANKLAQKLKRPLTIEVDTTHPLARIEQQILNAEKLARQGNHQQSRTSLINIQTQVNESQYPELSLLLLRKIIWLNIKQGNYQSLESLTTQMNTLSTQVTDPILDSKVQLNLSALVASHYGHYDQALFLYQKILDTQPTQSSQAATFNNIGLTLMEMSQYNESINYFTNALKIRVEQEDKYRIALTSLNLGIAHRKNQALSLAKPYLLNAQQLFSSLNDDYGTGNSSIQLAKLYLANDQPTQSLALLSQTIQTLNLEQYTELYFDTKITLAKSHLQLHQYDWALDAALSSLELIEQSNDTVHQLGALMVIINIHEALAQFEQAYTFQKRYLSLSQQHTQAQNQNALLTIQRELKLTEHELNTTRLEQSNLKQQHKIQELQYNQYRLWLTIIFVIFVTLLIWRSRNKQRYLAEHDTLTGTLNRAAMYKRLSKYTTSSKADYTHIIALFDLDHFKKINDTFGHPAGDQTLIHCCNSIAKAIKSPHFIARIGGEEFVLFVPNIHQKQAYEIIETARLSLVDAPVKLTDGKQIAVSASFAYYTCHHNEHHDFATVYKQLDDGLYQAKKQGRNCTISISASSHHAKGSP
uniref:diguanylate cyclase n=1 Tax=Pseudoalteromonas citrea DSM 8771 TaxID=1117314 RepID=U1J9Y7_9GAMM